MPVRPHEQTPRIANPAELRPLSIHVVRFEPQPYPHDVRRDEELAELANPE